MTAIPSTEWARILTLPVAPVMCDIEAAGGTFHADDGRLRVTPSGVVTPDQVAVLKAYRREVELIVAVAAAVGDELATRYEAFATACEAGTTAPVLVAGLPCERGACWSCYNRLESDRWGRCASCALALRLALPVRSIATTLPEARVA